MKILIIGLGSMGKRRLRLMKREFPLNEYYGIDARSDRRNEVEESFGIKTFGNLELALAQVKPDVAFVCASPLAHYTITKTCLERGISVFSEINLVNDNHEELIALAKKKELKLFLSSTPKYRKEIEYITNVVKSVKGKKAYCYHVGQYLPDWHPWENFSQFFVGEKKTNGCREILAIELPWLIDAFGEIEGFETIRTNITDLEVDFPDLAMLIIKHKGGNVGSVIFDVATRPSTRTLEIFREGFKLCWGGSPDKLQIYDVSNNEMKAVAVYEEIEKNRDYDASIIENMYVDELKNFFEVLGNKALPRHTYEKDKDVLNLIDRIESE